MTGRCSRIFAVIEQRQSLLIAAVTGERLVAALAGQHNLYVLLGEFRNKIKRDGRDKADRLVLMPDEIWQSLEKLFRRDRDLVMIGAEFLATSRAYSSSLASRSRKPTENVLIGSLTIVDIIAAIADESMPPDRNIPNGTSAISRSSTDWRNRSRHSFDIFGVAAGLVFRLEAQVPKFADVDAAVLPNKRVARQQRLTPTKSVSSPDVP